MAPVTLLQSRTSLLIWQGRKKPQWHLGHSHCYHANITHVSAVALTHHIFSQWVMTWLSYHWVLIITIIREILFSRRRKKNAFWKMHCQSPLRCMYTNQDFSLREWLLITALKLLTIWYNNQKLEAVLCFGHSCSFFVVCIFVPCTGRRKPWLVTCHTGTALREGADSHLGLLAAGLSQPPSSSMQKYSCNNKTPHL